MLYLNIRIAISQSLMIIVKHEMLFFYINFKMCSNCI